MSQFEHNYTALVRWLDNPKLPLGWEFPDRCIPRKEQSVLARRFFKAIGLQKISVTTPNYSMAQIVDVHYPYDATVPHELDKTPHHDRPWESVGACRECDRRWEFRKLLGKALLIAFPNHDDRSDSMSDYFDSCWSVDPRDCFSVAC